MTHEGHLEPAGKPAGVLDERPKRSRSIRPFDDGGEGNMGDGDPASRAAIVLAGGRSARLGGVPKAELAIDGVTLLQRAVDAAAPTLTTVVVGPPARLRRADRVVFAREDPPFGGPVRGLAAGLAQLRSALPAAPADLPVLLLGCDQPFAASAIPLLLAALEAGQAADGAIAVDDGGQRQPLLSCCRLGPLRAALDALDLSGAGKTPSLRRVIGGLDLIDVTTPADASYDIDTWQAAATVGARHASEPGPGELEVPQLGGVPRDDKRMVNRDPTDQNPEGRPIMTTPAELEPWAAALRAALSLPEEAPVDIGAILDMTGTVAHAVARPAAPLSAYLVGIAVGRGASLPEAIAATESAAGRWTGPAS